MDDNAPAHRAGEVTKWKEENNVNFLRWPAYSPDLNIIENVWAHLKGRLYEAKAGLKSPGGTWQKACGIWGGIDDDFMGDLYNNLPDRISALKGKKGGIIRPQ